jgi:hypothetical protein
MPLLRLLTHCWASLAFPCLCPGTGAGGHCWVGRSGRVQIVTVVVEVAKVQLRGEVCAQGHMASAEPGSGPAACASELRGSGFTGYRLEEGGGEETGTLDYKLTVSQSLAQCLLFDLTSLTLQPQCKRGQEVERKLTWHSPGQALYTHKCSLFHCHSTFPGDLLSSREDTDSEGFELEGPYPSISSVKQQILFSQDA